jgi:RNA polymerase sigma-70 factor (ECF subfamily)
MRPTIKISDFLLVSNYTNGDEKALETLVKKYQNSLINYIAYIIKDNDVANDIFQDTFIKFIDAVKNGKYKNNGSFQGYIQTIAHNLAMDHLRSCKKINTIKNKENWDVFDVINIEQQNCLDKIIEHEALQDSNKIMNLVFNEMPKKHKEILVLRLWQKKSFKQIAETKSMSINTCLGQYRYAISYLKKIIHENNLSTKLYIAN